MRRYEVKTLAGAAIEVERMLKIMGGYYIGWSKLETECSALTYLVRVDSVERFHSKLTVLFRIMDRLIDLIEHNLIYHLLNTIRSIDIKFPMTAAETAAVQWRKYPTMEAIHSYWIAKIFRARLITVMAKEVLPEIPADLARVEQLNKTVPGFWRERQQYLLWDNAPETRGNVDFKWEFRELVEDVNALIQGRAPRV